MGAEVLPWSRILNWGRNAHRQQSWARAFALLSEIDADCPLAADDLELIAEAANMVGRGADEVNLLRRAYLAHADAGDIALELSSSHHVLLAGRHPGQVPWRIDRWYARLLSPLMWCGVSAFARTPAGSTCLCSVPTVNRGNDAALWTHNPACTSSAGCSNTHLPRQ